jgi:hypothetical protein
MKRFQKLYIDLQKKILELEAEIRHYVTYRKNSYFTQSDRGNRYLERIISLYLTWKQLGQNPIKNLQNLLQIA